MKKLSRKSAEKLLGMIGTLVVLNLGEMDDFIEVMCELEIQVKTAMDVDFMCQIFKDVDGS